MNRDQNATEKEKKEDHETQYEKSQYSLILTAVISTILLIFGIYLFYYGGYLKIALFITGGAFSLIVYEIVRIIEWKKKARETKVHEKQDQPGKDN